MARGEDAAFGDGCEGFEEGEDQTVWGEVTAAAEEAVEMEGDDFGSEAEWARKAAQKFEKNGRLLVMVGTLTLSHPLHLCLLVLSSLVKGLEIRGYLFGEGCGSGARMRARCVLRPR